MRIGGIDFNKDSVKEMTFTEFKKRYTGKLRADLKTTFKKLGGKLNKK